MILAFRKTGAPGRNLKNLIITRRELLLGAVLGGPAGPLMGRGKQKNRPQDPSGNLVELTGTDAVDLLRSGDLSAEKYSTALIAQCRKYRALNAFIWQNEEQVLEAARSADKRWASGKVGPLHGLPILLKDNIDTAHAPTTAGTPALRNHR